MFYIIAECTIIVLLEYFYATEEVAAFHLFAVAKIEFGAESGYHNRRNQIPPLGGAVYNTNRPVNNTTDRQYGERQPDIAFYFIAQHRLSLDWSVINSGFFVGGFKFEDYRTQSIIARADSDSRFSYPVTIVK